MQSIEHKHMLALPVVVLGQ